MNGTLNIQLQAAGVGISANMTRTGDGGIGIEATIPVAKALSSWVKTDADTAAGNLAADHGWSTGTYDVYWTGGARYDVDVTITTNACALDGGTGTDFPASADTTVVLAQQTSVNVAIDGDRLEVLGIKLEFADGTLSSAGRALFEDAAGDDILSLPLVGNVARFWDIDGGDTNSFTGDPITTAKVSHANASYAATLKVAGIVDATP